MTTAGEVYVVALEAHERRRWRRAVVSAWTLATAATMGYLDGPSVGQWVVRRRADGTEAFRVEAGAEEEAALTLQALQEQLAGCPVEEFEKRWGIAGS
jgi:hypothetical protein